MKRQIHQVSRTLFRMKDEVDTLVDNLKDEKDPKWNPILDNLIWAAIYLGLALKVSKDDR